MAQGSSYREDVRSAICAMIENQKRFGIKRLQSEHQLAKKLMVSRETIRSVLNSLEYEGKIFRIHGSGTFINFHTSKAGLLYPCEDYGDVIRKNGFSDGVRVFPCRPAPADDHLRQALNLQGDTAACIPLVMLADNRPCILVLYYFAPSDVNESTVEYFGDTEHNILDMMDEVSKKRGSKLLWDDVEMYAAAAGDLDPQFYPMFEDHLPEAFFVQDSMFFDTANTPLCFSRSYIDAKKIHFYMIRRWR